MGNLECVTRLDSIGSECRGELSFFSRPTVPEACENAQWGERRLEGRATVLSKFEGKIAIWC